MIETYTLVVWLSWGWGWATHEKRTPGLSRVECKLMALDVKWPKRGRCDPEPPIMSPKRYTVCNFGDLCWEAPWGAANIDKATYI